MGSDVKTASAKKLLFGHIGETSREVEVAEGSGVTHLRYRAPK